MATAIPAIKASMGSTPYYVTTMTARELINNTRPAAEDRDKWTSASIDERMQREPYLKRVKEQIVPYLAEHEDRFFGSIIVVVPEGSLRFEPMTTYLKATLPPGYTDEATNMGFLLLGKGDRVILDGQHRWYAEREVLQSNEYLGRVQDSVADDDLTVIFIENDDPRKTRGIFNKVNRYAKPTTRSDNILTSEDDGYAIVTRRLLDPTREDAPLAERETEDEEGRVRKYELVQWKSNTLTKTMRHLTTIAVVYDNVKNILVFGGRDDLDRVASPPENVLQAATDAAAPWFFAFLDNLDAYREALQNPDSIKENRFDLTHPDTLLLRPVGQIVLVRGIIRAMEASSGSEGIPHLTLNEAIRRVNQIDFSATPDSIWRDTIVRASGRMVARNEAYNLASNLLAYLIAGEYYTADDKHALWETWNYARGNETNPEKIKELNAKGVIDGLPEELPEPIE